MKYLIALDLEGVGGVVGAPYSGLKKESEEWYKARAQAILEVNTVAKALFDTGAELVALWDNHAGGGNLEYSLLDERIELIVPDNSELRQSFAKKFGFDAMYILGYHAMEGTVAAVLAHTFNSNKFQYFKINSRPVGEIAIDSYMAAENGYALTFLSGDDKACLEAKNTVPGIITVETKKGISRNKAILRSNEELLSRLYEKAKLAATLRLEPQKLEFPLRFEIRYTRMEDAEKAIEVLKANGEDAYIIGEIIKSDEKVVIA